MFECDVSYPVFQTQRSASTIDGDMRHHIVSQYSAKDCYHPLREL
jgi:hypothetical protein